MYSRTLIITQFSDQVKILNQSHTIINIVDLLLSLDPYRIVLFGSYALERENPESDLDLLIILDSETISQTYKDRMRRRIAARNCIREINQEIPIDLLVYTKAEYAILQQHGASFLNEIDKSGKTLYEKTG